MRSPKPARDSRTLRVNVLAAVGVVAVAVAGNLGLLSLSAVAESRALFFLLFIQAVANVWLRLVTGAPIQGSPADR